MGLKRQDVYAVFLLLILTILLLWPVTVGGKTLLPIDNLFGFEPWRSHAEEWDATIPHNELLSDLILENYVWKKLIRTSLQAGEIPLWNPYVFAGLPFLAAGQHSALYPFSIIFYILPLPAAYGWFTALQLFLAGLAMYGFCRVLRCNHLGALAAGITYMLSGFFIMSVVFTMVIAAAAWLPLLLTSVELVVRRHEEALIGPARSPLPWVLVGAVTIGMVFLAGHVEVAIYSLMVSGLYALWRLATLWRLAGRRTWLVGRGALQLAGMVLLGIGLGAVQWIPLYELVTRSFRQGSASYTEIIGWSYPTRQLITFLIPDFFGNPSHHGYWDVVSRQWVAASHNALGQPIRSIFWGIKNYVEAGSYVGTLPLLLAATAILGKRCRTTWFFLLLGLISLLFAFGTPLYALLYYLVPGFDQLHSPFRWVFPYTLGMSVLAGIGVSRLYNAWSTRDESSQFPKVAGWLGIIAGATGSAGLATLMVAFLVPDAFIGLAQRFVESSELARSAFADGRAFFSYQFRNLLIFFTALTASGVVLRLASRRHQQVGLLGDRRLWSFLVILVVALELIVIGRGFNPAVEPALLDVRPAAVDFLIEQRDNEGHFRFTTFNLPGEKTFNANVGMRYDLEDIRGYDSIIPQQYVDYMEAIAPQSNELLYNRIAPIYAPDYDVLDSRLLDMLNVRYVITTHHIPNPGYELVFDGEVRIYENLDALPRAFFIAREELLSRHEILRRLPSLEPTQTVLLEGVLPEEDRFALAQDRATTLFAPATVTYTSRSEAYVEVEVDGAGWLVLADSHFPGWKAFVRPKGGTEEDEIERAIFLANGNFRAVRLDAGAHIVRFKYAPMSFRLGLFATFLAGVVGFLLLAYYLWNKTYREEDDEDAIVRRVAKNSLTPMILSLVNKAIDFAFAMLRLRILEPMGEGRYTFAIVFIGYFQILTLFGLGTLLTREVSKDKESGNRYLGNTVALRVILWVLSVPLMALAAHVYYRLGHLTADTAWAITLFAVAMFFSNMADALSAVFYAHERMEYPAGISAVINVFKVSLGTLVLLLGWGFVGLAGVSLAGNLLTVTILFLLARREFFRPRLETDLGFQRDMLKTSFPLMINHLMATVFFRIDMLLLKPMRGDAVVGYYSAAYKYIDGLNVIPSYFTLAIFPLMSRFAESARDSLVKAYILSIRLLLMISLPIAVGTPFIATELILLLGGAKFLPESAIALKLLIWFLPFSYVNSVTQYVLIAIDQQRFLTKAFLIGVTFNTVANVIFIPLYGFQAAAVITVLSELVLMVPFYYCVRRHLGPLPWLHIVWQPAVAALAMGVGLWMTSSITLLLRLPLAVIVYVGTLAAVGGFKSEDIALLRRMLPQGRLRRILDRLFGVPKPLTP